MKEPTHPDKKYIESISGNKGSAWGYKQRGREKGLAYITYIYGKNWFVIRYYNFKLLLRFIRRKFKSRFK